MKFIHRTDSDITEAGRPQSLLNPLPLKIVGRNDENVALRYSSVRLKVALICSAQLQRDLSCDSVCLLDRVAAVPDVIDGKIDESTTPQSWRVDAIIRGIRCCFQPIFVARLRNKLRDCRFHTVGAVEKDAAVLRHGVIVAEQMFENRRNLQWDAILASPVAIVEDRRGIRRRVRPSKC